MRNSDLNTFYKLLTELEALSGGKRLLVECRGKMTWPKRGVYFFFEPGETRAIDSTIHRVVRVGTHAVAATSRTTVWTRLRQHRGNAKSVGGNHRGSIFRGLAGEAMMERGLVPRVKTWRQDKSASKEIRLLERDLEEKVSEYLGNMTLLVLPVLDPPGRDSQRCFIEQNSIAMLSNFLTQTPDQPSPNWLGSSSVHPRVSRSGLWNRDYVDKEPHPEFLKILETLVRASSSQTA